MVTKYCHSHWSSWLKTSPWFTTFRVNTLITSPDEFQKMLLKELEQVADERNKLGLKSELPSIYQHEQIPELVVMSGWRKNTEEMKTFSAEVIVDAACGKAVLRGSHVFAPGVLGLSKGALEGDRVSIYVSLGGPCKRGWNQRLESSEKLFVGNGILLLSRKKLFGGDVVRGIAVRVLDNASGCPTLNADFSSLGMALMQNLPSVVCGRVLNPKPQEVVLDMCAAPGNKTSHLSSLMNNQGIVVALDRSAQRIEKLKKLCTNFGVKNVHAFVYDSVKAVKSSCSISGTEPEASDIDFSKGPPFPLDSFDCILLDAPCSGSGQRPQLEPINLEHCASFPHLQKKLIKSAVNLLKPGGRLVYSTCSVLHDENENIVRWALDSFPSLKLMPALPLCSPRQVENPTPDILTSEEWNCLQKFPPQSSVLSTNNFEEDTIGFFIAQFIKLAMTGENK